jgi:ferredoxin--NADP+ reductase
VADATSGACPTPTDPDPAAAEAMVRARQPHLVTYPDWTRLDQAETARGQSQGRPRVKFCSVEEMLEVLAVGRLGG